MSTLGYEIDVPGRPEIVGFWGLHGPLLPQHLLEKVGGQSPPPFPVGFVVGGGRLDPQNIRFPARKIYCAT